MYSFSESSRVKFCFQDPYLLVQVVLLSQRIPLVPCSYEKQCSSSDEYFLLSLLEPIIGCTSNEMAVYNK